MATERIYYTPPEGSPPFKFTYNGAEYVIQPPDQFWTQRKKDEKKVVGKTRAGKDILQEEFEWVPDEKMNASGKKPRNYIDASKAMIAWARREENQKHLPDIPMAEWLKTSQEFDQQLDSDYHDRRRTMDEKIKEETADFERIRRELAEKRELLQRQLEEANAELQKGKQATAKR